MDSGKEAGEAEGRVYLTESEIRKANNGTKVTLFELKSLILDWLDKNYDPEKHNYFTGYFVLRDSDTNNLKYALEFDLVKIIKKPGWKERVENHPGERS